MAEKEKEEMKKSKRYSCYCVGQAVINPLYEGYASFRVEIYDRKRKDGYAIAEASFLVPQELYEKLYEIFEGYESDIMPVISWEPLKPWRNAKGEVIQP